MRFGILGPLLVSRDGEPVAVGSPKQQALLSLLLLRPNRLLTADWLAEALWDGSPPSSALVTLRTYVAGLRRALEPGRGPRSPGRIVRSHTGGYELCVPPEAIDAVRFTALADEGARALADGDPVAAERRYTEALALWRGEPAVADLAAVRPDVARLTEARLSGEEGRLAAAVAAGRHGAVLPDLRRFVDGHPAREAGREQLMLALYRAGRQTEALEVFDAGRRLLAGEFGVEPGPRLRELHRLILTHTVPPAAAPAAARRRPLVGRDAELARLAQLLAAAGGDGGRIATIVGEPGIGKTSLAAAVADRAAAAGIPVVWGRCPDLGEAPPFWLWTQVLRGLAVLPGSGEPGASTALSGFTAEAATGADGPDPAARFRAYEAVAGLVHAVAEPSGLVVVLDDLHAADPDSRLLLRYLATTVHRSRALVVVTSRPYDHDAGLVAMLADLARAAGGGQLRLEGLGTAAVADLVHDRTGAAPAAGLVERLVHRTGGNPFFLTELLASAGPSRDRDALPPSVRDAVLLRLRAPNAATRECLDLLGVAGRELDLRLLNSATGTDAAELLAAPDAAHLIAGAGPGAVRFRHPLFAEVAYAELAAPRRAVLHARLAGTAAGMPGLGGLTPAELARHYGQAVGLGHGEDFLRWTLRAADDATWRLAYEDALAHLDRAAARLAPDAATSPDAAEAELTVQLHRTSLLQITVGVGSDAVEQAAARARRLLPLAGPGADLRTALWTLGEVACNRAEYAIGADLARRLTGAPPDGDPLIAAAGPYLLGVVDYFTGRLAEADAQLTIAVDRLRTVEPRRLRGQVGRTPTLSPYNFRALVRSLRGDRPAAHADLAAARQLAEHADDPYGRGNAVLFAAWVALQERDAPAGREAAGRCREIGERQHMPHFVGIGDLLADWAAVHGGERARLTAMRAAGEAIYRHGLRATRTIVIAAMADAYLTAGDPATAAALADEGLAAAEAAGERVLTAELRRVRGLARGDDRDVRRGAAIAAEQGAGLLVSRCGDRPPQDLHSRRLR
ncbi:BTAD domain-containing putative transcriptional regulator [Dactylosporangium sp. AC04546]|uniref:BTAD domain-containing putative transcriptional regulator n=1 Tax=Dactylosporangium sp. AC04546 TaxID=2862460 RepID=UPI001EDD2BB6|nr:BTAD domain-containing putative transcriptional regulator [Dactylosporangium sp. AC04546]WVK88791.1 BTAD domain-containing putative transcriptional regulator [Dactylosporangium sp. AC04546]